MLVYDIATDKLRDTIEIPGTAMWVVRNEDLGLGYAAAGNLTIYELDSLDVVDTISIPAGGDARFIPNDEGTHAVVGGAERLFLVDLVGDADPVSFPNPRGLAGRLDPSGRVIIGWGSSPGQGMQLWDVESRRPLGPFVGGTFGDQHIGGALAQHRSDGLWVWDIDVDEWPDLACDLAGRALTQAEWDEYMTAGTPYDPVDCSRA